MPRVAIKIVLVQSDKYHAMCVAGVRGLWRNVLEDNYCQKTQTRYINLETTDSHVHKYIRVSIVVLKYCIVFLILIKAWVFYCHK